MLRHWGKQTHTWTPTGNRKSLQPITIFVTRDHLPSRVFRLLNNTPFYRQVTFCSLNQFFVLIGARNATRGYKIFSDLC